MDKVDKGKWPLGTWHHVGVVVKGMDKAVEYYESLGMEPFQTLSIDLHEIWVRGKRIHDLGVEVKYAHVNPIRLELLQPIEGKGYIWEEFLKSKGEGIHHLGFVVDDIDKTEAELVKKGFNVIFKATWTGGGSVYVESDEMGSVILEFFQRPSK